MKVNNLMTKVLRFKQYEDIGKCNIVESNPKTVRKKLASI